MQRHQEHGHHGGHHQHHSRHHGDDNEHSHSHADEDMLEVEEAFARIMECFRELEPEEKPVLECLGQVLAEDVSSPLSLPPMANSAMDGYALLHQDIQGASAAGPANLEVIGRVAAGEVSTQTVTPGTAIRIMTGAPVPQGADTVVPFEETDEIARRNSGETLDRIAIMADLPLSANVRPAGEDVRQGDLVLEAGTVVRSSEVAVLASLGMTHARVIRRPVVGILSTGDELVSEGDPLGPGQIYDSNSSGVAASVLAAGGVPRLLGIARDNLDDLHRKLEEGAGSDMLITSAGVSKGDYDMVKDVLTQRGDMNFWSVRMRPAKPLAFGHLDYSGGKRVPLIGLPGNPVSAMVAFEMFGRPAIHTMLGRGAQARPSVEGVLTGPIYNTDGRRVYARVEVERRDGEYFANPTGPQGSNILTSMSRANGLAVCPADEKSKAAGDRVRIIMLNWNEEVAL